jgi:hypothetical protein
MKSFEGAMERPSDRHQGCDLASFSTSTGSWKNELPTLLPTVFQPPFQLLPTACPYTPPYLWALEAPRWKTGPNAGGREAARQILVFTVALLRLDCRAARLSEGRLSHREQLLAGPRSSGFGVAIRMPAVSSGAG